MANRRVLTRWWLVATYVFVLATAAGCGAQPRGGGQGPLPVAAYATEAIAGSTQLGGDAPPAPIQPAPSVEPMGPAEPTATPPAATPDAAIPPAGAAPPAGTAYDPDTLAADMLARINSDRAAAGLGPVAWDEAAASVARAHAADMITRAYFSHWNPDGLGPDHRHAAAGPNAVRENLYTVTSAFPDGRGAIVDDWPAMIAQAQAQLMNSPGHRANILDPAHSHVGVGMAYDAAAGRFTVVQEFTNRHATLSSPLPAEARPGDVVRVAGVFGPQTVGGAILDLAHEPFPAPLPAAELAARSTYTSAARSLGVGRSIGNTFDETITLPAEPGLYHLRLYVNVAAGQTLAIDHIIAVR